LMGVIKIRLTSEHVNVKAVACKRIDYQSIFTG